VLSIPKNKWTVSLSAEADADLFEIWDYLASEASERVADRQLRRIEAAFERLKSWPYSGRKRDEMVVGMRSVPTDQYVVSYRVHADTVEVIRVLHGRRDFASILVKKFHD
jgi:toxin ParE1/3/4